MQTTSFIRSLSTGVSPASHTAVNEPCPRAVSQLPGTLVAYLVPSLCPSSRDLPSMSRRSPHTTSLHVASRASYTPATQTSARQPEPATSHTSPTHSLAIHLMPFLQSRSSARDFLLLENAPRTNCLPSSMKRHRRNDTFPIMRRHHAVPLRSRL